MPKIQYLQKRFQAESLKTIQTADAICVEYANQGYTLTLRQLYYQFVSRGLIPNKDTEYKRLGALLNDARMAGLLDWNHMEDRTRNLRALSHWDNPSGIIESAALSYRNNRWDRQAYRPEVWIEKDALVGVIAGVCQANDVPYFSCRGYTSVSEMWAAGQRFTRYLKAGQQPIIFHLGDHDPSGLDMSRDIEERLNLFAGAHTGKSWPIQVKRLALNMDQVQQYDPPPNPAKLTDSRGYDYVSRFGDESWELDALEPTVLGALIQDAIDSVKDLDQWEDDETRESLGKEVLGMVAKHWDRVNDYLSSDEFLDGLD